MLGACSLVLGARCSVGALLRWPGAPLPRILTAILTTSLPSSTGMRRFSQIRTVSSDSCTTLE